jgi:hypothetical protein
MGGKYKNAIRINPPFRRMGGKYKNALQNKPPFRGYGGKNYREED